MVYILFVFRSLTQPLHTNTYKYTVVSRAPAPFNTLFCVHVVSWRPASYHLHDKTLCDLTNIDAGDLSTYLLYDPLQGCFANYLKIGAPISVRPGKFLIYWHVDTSDKDCFGLKLLVRKLHRTIWNVSTHDSKGKHKAEDSDGEIEYLGRYTSYKARKNKHQKVEVDEDNMLDLCSD